MEPDWSHIAASGGADAADVYAAEELFGERLADTHVDPGYLSPDAVAAFMLDVLNRSDWGEGWQLEDLPELRFDVPDEGDLAGVHGGASTGAIHLHPKLAHPMAILHELAHWLRPRDRHGEQFRSTLVGLVRVAFGPEHSVALTETYAEYGLTSDW